MRFNETVARYGKGDVVFTRHAISRMKEVPFEEDFITGTLLGAGKLAYEEWHEGSGTYKLVYSHSKRYCIVIVVAPHGTKLHVVTAYKTSRTMQQLVKDGGTLYVSKGFNTDV